MAAEIGEHRENVNEPMNSQQTMAVVRAVRNTDSFSFCSVSAR